MILLSLNVVYGAQLEVSDQILTDNVYPGGVAVFEITIRNNRNVGDTFSITPDEFSVAPFSDIIESIEIDKYNVNVNANSVKTFQVRVTMREDIIPDRNYGTFINIVSSFNPSLKVKQDLTIGVVSPDELISISSDITDRIVPGKELSLNVFFKNKLNLILDEVDIVVDSELFNQEDKLKLFPYQDEQRNYNFEISPNTEPGVYSLIITTTQKNKLKGSYIKDFEIISNPNINERTEKDSRFLIQEIKVTKTNNGNLVVKEGVVVELSSFRRLFTNYNVAPTKIGDKIEWSFNLEPGESLEIVALTNYKSLFIFVIVVLVVIGLIWYFHSRKVSIKKTIFKVRETEEGSELKIMLHVKNRLTDLKDIEVIDILPNLIKPKHEFGTLKPAKIQKGVRGVRIVWNVESLLEGEERVISYVIQSKLEIFGKLALPKAIVRYKRKNRFVEVRSNRLDLLK
tara:strand:+ start:32391 stop:33758 length:1368 start_codon:yes stop_codon:yes gene_type:complete